MQLLSIDPYVIYDPSKAFFDRLYQCQKNNWKSKRTFKHSTTKMKKNMEYVREYVRDYARPGSDISFFLPPPLSSGFPNCSAIVLYILNS